MVCGSGLLHAVKLLLEVPSIDINLPNCVSLLWYFALLFPFFICFCCEFLFLCIFILLFHLILVDWAHAIVESF